MYYCENIRVSYTIFLLGGGGGGGGVKSCEEYCHTPVIKFLEFWLVCVCVCGGGGGGGVRFAKKDISILGEAAFTPPAPPPDMRCHHSSTVYFVHYFIGCLIASLS